MSCHLISLPPELLLDIAEVAEYSSLCSLLRTSRFLHVLLWPILYRRETAQSNPVGFLRSIRLGSTSAVSKFMAVNADVNAKIEPGDYQDFTGYTYPLATAVVRDQRDIVDLLLQNGANPNAQIDGLLCHIILADHIHPWASVLSNTPLTVAVAMGHINIAVQLARALADPDPVVSTVLSTKYTALDQAARCVRPAVVRQLLEQGANPNKRQPHDDTTLLFHLLEDPSLQDFIDSMEDGESAFVDVVMTLLRYGSDPFIKRVCRDHDGGEPGKAEKCGPACNLTAWSVGVRSPYPKIRQHFKDLGHRQHCGKPACRGSKLSYALQSEEIPGHCRVV